MVYSKAAVYTCKPLLYKKNLKERCYLHSVQQSYEKNSCKPGIKYFTSVNHWFTLVNCRLTLVNHHFTVICWFTLVNCCFTVIHQFTAIHQFTVIHQFTKDHLLRTAIFFWFSSTCTGLCWYHIWPSCRYLGNLLCMTFSFHVFFTSFLQSSLLKLLGFPCGCL